MAVATKRRYTKLADWDYIRAAAAAAPGLQLIGNGDIMSFTEYNERVVACPDLATVMLARGALIKPWLFTEVSRGLHRVFEVSLMQCGLCNYSGLRWRSLEPC